MPAPEGKQAVEVEDEEREELDQVVYYYDVATVWIRPIDFKVSVGWFTSGERD